MNRRTFREMLVKLVYNQIVGGETPEEEVNQELLAVFSQVKANFQDLDRIISENLSNYTIDRLNYVDLAIFRVAVFEIKYQNLPSNVAINEALEITKKYSNLDDDQARKFNNRLLDKIKKYLEEQS
jgi:N utilization substance protein B